LRWYAVTVDRLTPSISHTGAVIAGPLVLTLVPPAAVRRWNAMPLPGVTKSDACRALASRPSRIITPAFVHGWTFCTLRT
jgi:hypothetical protein